MPEKSQHENSRPIYSFIFLAIAVAIATLTIHPAADANNQSAATARKWVASWATSPANSFFYTPPTPSAPAGVAGTDTAPYRAAHFAGASIQPDQIFPFPNSTTGPTAAGSSPVAENQTFRSIVKPDLWSDTIRIRFSNTFGTQPVTFNSVTVGLQEYSANVVPGTLTRVTFGSKRSVTIPVGQEIWSDPVKLTWVKSAGDIAVQGRNLAVSYFVQGNSGPMTYHSGANQTSFITAAGSGDHTSDLDVFAYQFTTVSWFFIDGIDVMAPADTVVVCAFGDSITDGAHATLNIDDRWVDTLSRRLHDAYGNRVSIVNEAIGGNRVVGPLTGPGGTLGTSASGQAAVDRLDRDVLGLSGLKAVIWLEGINDLGGGHSPDAIVAGYRDVVDRLHAKGIKVYGATMTSALGISGTDAGDNGPGHDANRKIINDFILHSGVFDGAEDFDAATLDEATGNMKAEYLPNSQLTQLPLDYLHPNHAGYIAMGDAVDIKPFAPAHSSAQQKPKPRQ